MAKVGRKTVLNKELFRKIKECILDGKNLRDLAKICDINETTLYTWHSDNYLDIADKIEGWKRDRKIKLASDNVEAILQLSTTDKDFVKVVQDTSKFVLEALDNNYKPKKDITSNGNTIGKLLEELDDTNTGTKE